MADVVRDFLADLFSEPQRFVKSITDESQQFFQPPYHGDNLKISWRFLKRNIGGGVLVPYTVIDLTGASLAVKFWDIITTPGTPIILASQTSWAIDSTGKIASGTISLYQAGMIAAIAPVSYASYLSCVLEATLTLGDGTVYTYRDNAFRVGRSINLPGSPSGTPGDTFYTQIQSNAAFVPKDGPAGGFFVMRSAAGVQVQVYIADLADGGIEFRTERIT